MRILVSGAGGFIGRYLVPFLEHRGHDVVPLRRGAGTALPDLAAVGSWPDWPAGIDAIVHLAALNPSRGEAARSDATALRHANVDATRAFAQRAAREGVGRFLFVSTANVHRPKGADPVRETDAPEPQSPYAASKLAAEAALRAVADGTDLETSVLRLPPVHGPGGRGLIASLAAIARLPVPLPFGGAGGRRSVLSLDNALDAIATVLVHPDAAGETFLVADEHPLSLGEMVAALRRGLGRSPGLLPFPRRPLRGIATLTGRAETFERLFGGFVLDTSHIASRLGWRPPVSGDEGFARTIRGHEQAGTP